MKKTLQEIAEYVGGRVEGDASIVISGLDNIEGAGEHDLTFAVDPHIEEAKACQAAGIDFDGKEAHSARYDTEKTAELFCGIVNRWKELGGWDDFEH